MRRTLIGPAVGLFDRLRRSSLSEPNVSAGWEEAEWLTWESPANVVKESHYQDALHEMCGDPCPEGYLIPVAVVLRREPRNQYDRNAIAVVIDGIQVGHIAREAAAQISPVVDRAGCGEWTVCGVIRGGTTRQKSLGVHLWTSRLLSAGPGIYFDDDTFAVRSWPPSKERIEQAIRTLVEP